MVLFSLEAWCLNISFGIVLHAYGGKFVLSINEYPSSIISLLHLFHFIHNLTNGFTTFTNPQRQQFSKPFSLACMHSFEVCHYIALPLFLLFNVRNKWRHFSQVTKYLYVINSYQIYCSLWHRILNFVSIDE